jgi:hypothetical protein
LWRSLEALAQTAAPITFFLRVGTSGFTRERRKDHGDRHSANYAAHFATDAGATWASSSTGSTFDQALMVAAATPFSKSGHHHGGRGAGRHRDLEPVQQFRPAPGGDSACCQSASIYGRNIPGERACIRETNHVRDS